MGCFQDYREGYTTPEANEHDAMDAAGFDSDCSEDRELWRHCKACGKCSKCNEVAEEINERED